MLYTSVQDYHRQRSAAILERRLTEDRRKRVRDAIQALTRDRRASEAQ